MNDYRAMARMVGEGTKDLALDACASLMGSWLTDAGVDIGFVNFCLLADAVKRADREAILRIAGNAIPGTDAVALVLDRYDAYTNPEPDHIVTLVETPDRKNGELPYTLLLSDDGDTGGIRWAWSDLDAPMARAVAGVLAGVFSCEVASCGTIPVAHHNHWLGEGFGCISTDDPVGRRFVSDTMSNILLGAEALHHDGSVAGVQEGVASMVATALRWMEQNGKDGFGPKVLARRVLALVAMELGSDD